MTSITACLALPPPCRSTAKKYQEDFSGGMTSGGRSRLYAGATKVLRVKACVANDGCRSISLTWKPVMGKSLH